MKRLFKQLGAATVLAALAVTAQARPHSIWHQSGISAPGRARAMALSALASPYFKRS